MGPLPIIRIDLILLFLGIFYKNEWLTGEQIGTKLCRKAYNQNLHRSFSLFVNNLLFNGFDMPRKW
ncbi:MAG: hypothetical protein ACJAZV_002443 [Roseivirga sp.]|jgi:hypothetical protein